VSLDLAFEHMVRAFEPRKLRRAQPLAELARILDPRTVQTPALDRIDAELDLLLDIPDGRLILSMPPQEGKSVRVAKVFPVKALQQDPDRRIVVASYGHDLARRNGRSIRDAIVGHPELGLRVRIDVAAQHEWQVQGHDGGVYAAGIGTALTGRPSNLMVIDDPIKDRREADSETYRQNVWDWWLEVASTRLAPGAPVVVIATRWHEDDLIGRLLAAEDGALWRVLNIPAQADYRPERGESDPLGREPGEFMASARGRTVAQWEAIKVRSGARTWASLYQGRPSPAEGGILKRHWWRRFEHPLWIDRADGARIVPGADHEIVQSWDMAFKDTKGSDFVVGQVWMRRGVDAYLLDQVRGRMSFTDTCAAVRSLSARWPQAVLKLVEDTANGPAVINALARIVPGLVPVQPDGSKLARASAVSPFAEAGNVHVPADELAPWVGEWIEELAAFPNSAHDDQVDAFSQAINRLLLNPLLEEQIVEDESLDDAFGYMARY
jgi:predicted phage terminase large subunit-like protein